MCVQPLDKLERQEVRREALKYVDKGFQLVAKEKVGFRLCRVLALRNGQGICLVNCRGPDAVTTCYPSAWCCTG